MRSALAFCLGTSCHSGDGRRHTSFNVPGASVGFEEAVLKRPLPDPSGCFPLPFSVLLAL